MSLRIIPLTLRARYNRLLFTTSITINTAHTGMDAKVTIAMTTMTTTLPQLSMTTTSVDTKTSLEPVSFSIVTTPTVTMTTVTMTTVNMTTDTGLNIGAVVAPVVVVVLVVCLLVASAVATIIILYHRAHRASQLHYKPGTDYTTVFEMRQRSNTGPPLPPAPYRGQNSNTQLPAPYRGQHSNTQLPAPYHGQHSNTQLPAPYRGQHSNPQLPADEMITSEYSVPNTTRRYEEDNATERKYYTLEPPIYNGAADIGEYSLPDKKKKKKAQGDYRTMKEEGIQQQDRATGRGRVYSAVVRKDGKKTTVKTTALNDDNLDMIDTIEESVYDSAIRQHGHMTCVVTDH